MAKRTSKKQERKVKVPKKKSAKEVAAAIQAEIESREPPPEVELGAKPPDMERRWLRYILFRLKRSMVHTMDRDLRELVPAIQAYFERELDRKGLTWAGFTFKWDVGPKDVFAIISPSPHEWVLLGGEFEGKPGQMTEAEWAKHVVAEGIAARRKPPAFTRQE